MKNTQKGFIVPLLIAIITVSAISGGIYYYSQNKPEVPQTVNNTQPIQKTTPAPAVGTQTNSGANVQPNKVVATNPKISDQTTGWKTYANTTYGFEIKYPSNFSFTDNSSFLSTYGKNLPTKNPFMSTIGFPSQVISTNVPSSIASILVAANFVLPQNCYESSTGIPSTQTIVKNGISYRITETDSDGGITYATLRNNICYQLALGGVGVNGGSSKLDKTEIDQFDNIVSTFSFTK